MPASTVRLLALLTGGGAETQFPLMNSELSPASMRSRDDLLCKIAARGVPVGGWRCCLNHGLSFALCKLVLREFRSRQNSRCSPNCKPLLAPSWGRAEILLAGATTGAATRQVFAPQPPPYASSSCGCFVRVGAPIAATRSPDRNGSSRHARTAPADAGGIGHRTC